MYTPKQHDEMFDKLVRELEAGDTIHVAGKNEGEEAVTLVVLRRENEKICISRIITHEEPYTGPLNYGPFTWNGRELRDRDNDVVKWFTAERISVEKGGGDEVVHNYKKVPRAVDIRNPIQESFVDAVMKVNKNRIPLFDALIKNDEFGRPIDLLELAFLTTGIHATPEQLVLLAYIIVQAITAAQGMVVGILEVMPQVADMQRARDEQKHTLH